MRRGVCLVLTIVTVAMLVSACQGASAVGHPAPFLNISVAVPAGMVEGQNTQWVATVTGAATPYSIHWDFGGGAIPDTVDANGETGQTSTATVSMLSGSWLAQVSIIDHDGNPVSTASPGVAYSVAPAGTTLEPLEFAADTLYAIPVQATAAVGAPVTVVVATGIPANPFQYMNGVGLTVPSDGRYVGGDPAHGGTGGGAAGSFNVGVPGGDAGQADGFWTAMAPAGGFLLAPDNFNQSVDIGSGRQRFDFNVTPLGGSNQFSAKGALFNAQFVFSAAGTKVFGFEQLNAVKRTYYSDEATEYFWGDISNYHPGVSNSVVIQ